MNKLSKILSTVRTAVRAFGADVSGGLSVEYVMWVPFMASGMVLTTDVTILMREQSHLFVMARDTSRMVAVGRYTATEAAQVMEARLGDDKNYSVSADTGDTFVKAKVSVPFSDVLVFGGMFTGENTLQGYATMLIEGGDFPQ